MGIFDSLAGGLFGEATPGNAKVSNADIFQQVFQIPLAFQAMQAAASLGIAPSELFGDAFIGKKGLKKAQKASPGTVFSIGNGQGVDLDKLIPKLPEIFNKVQAKGIESFQNTYDKLSKVPALSSIFSQAGGGASPLAGKINEAFGQLGEFALGNAAKTGLLNNPLIQAKALAPLALQKAQYEVGLQQQKEAQALGFAGAPGLAGVNPLFNQQIPSAQSYIPGINAAAQLSGQLASLNASNALTASMFNAQQGADLFGTAIGFASPTK